MRLLKLILYYFVRFSLEGQKLSYNGFAHREQRDTGVGLSDICTLHRVRASLVSLTHHDECNEEAPKAIAVELVGDRFLRRMVRILVVSEKNRTVSSLDSLLFVAGHSCARVDITG